MLSSVRAVFHAAVVHRIAPRPAGRNRRAGGVQRGYFNSGSRGRPSMRSAMVLRVISEVPPAIVMARLPR